MLCILSTHVCRHCAHTITTNPLFQPLLLPTPPCWVSLTLIPEHWQSDLEVKSTFHWIRIARAYLQLNIRGKVKQCPPCPMQSPAFSACFQSALNDQDIVTGPAEKLLHKKLCNLHKHTSLIVSLTSIPGCCSYYLGDIEVC